MLGDCQNKEGGWMITDGDVQGFTLLNSDDHIGLLKKMKVDPVNVRPDICHQVGNSIFNFHLELARFAG